MWANVGVLAGFGLVFLALTAVYFLVTRNNKKAKRRQYSVDCISKISII